MTKPGKHYLRDPRAFSLLLCAVKLGIVTVDSGPNALDLHDALRDNKKGLPTVSSSEKSEPRSAKEAEALVKTNNTTYELYSLENPVFCTLDVSE